MTTVLTFGTFDFFHPGHIHYLEQAKKLGTKLVIVVALDSTVQAVKGHPPTQSQNTRKQQVEDSHIADLVILGHKTDRYKVLTDYKPDIIALGYDQSSFTENLESAIINAALNSKIIRISSFKPNIFKSTHLKKV